LTGPFLDAIIGGGGGGIFIYSCSHTVKTIAFKRNPSGRTHIYVYTPPLIMILRSPISCMTTNGCLLIVNLFSTTAFSVFKIYHSSITTRLMSVVHNHMIAMSITTTTKYSVGVVCQLVPTAYRGALVVRLFCATAIPRNRIVFIHLNRGEKLFVEC
jgi:hypothetical protein